MKAKLFAKIEQDLLSNIDAVSSELQQQTKLQESINDYEQDIARLRLEIEKVPKRVKIKDMPVEARYNKLKSQSKLIMNTIRNIAYRSECALANMLAPYCARAEEEIRMLVKEIINESETTFPGTDLRLTYKTVHSHFAIRQVF